MCIVLQAAERHTRIEVDFVLERIYLRRDGSIDVWQDMLVRNISQFQSITRLRVILPYPLVALSQLKLGSERKSPEAIDSTFKSLQRSQLGRFEKNTTGQLGVPANKNNWPYRTLPYVEIDSDACREGQFGIKRKSQKEGLPDRLSGFIKTGWTLDQCGFNSTHDRWVWAACTLLDLAAFDYVAPRPQSKEEEDRCKREHLHTGEKMWIRLKLHVPAYGYNKKNLWETIVAPNHDFQQVFKSPGRIRKEIQDKMNRFDPQALVPHSVELANTAKDLRDRLLGGEQTTYRDWRTFMFREYGLETVQGLPRFSGSNVLTPGGSNQLSIPPEAEPNAQRGPYPKFFNWLNEQLMRTVVADDFFFGSDVGDGADDFEFAIDVRSPNSLYAYLTWLALPLGIWGALFGGIFGVKFGLIASGVLLGLAVLALIFLILRRR